MGYDATSITVCHSSQSTATTVFDAIYHPSLSYHPKAGNHPRCYKSKTKENPGLSRGYVPILQPWADTSSNKYKQIVSLAVGTGVHAIVAFFALHETTRVITADDYKWFGMSYCGSWMRTI